MIAFALLLSLLRLAPAFACPPGELVLIEQGEVVSIDPRTGLVTTPARLAGGKLGESEGIYFLQLSPGLRVPLEPYCLEE